jgi:hypothetical protein
MTRAEICDPRTDPGDLFFAEGVANFWTLTVMRRPLG